MSSNHLYYCGTHRHQIWWSRNYKRLVTVSYWSLCEMYPADLREKLSGRIEASGANPSASRRAAQRAISKAILAAAEELSWEDYSRYLTLTSNHKHDLATDTGSRRRRSRAPRVASKK